MKVTLNRTQIELAISLGEQTLARYIAAYGEYNNTFNSHTKGRFGEIALETVFLAKGRTVISHFMNPASDPLCDMEVSPGNLRRLEVKTWSEAHWDNLGRCMSINQTKKLAQKADAVIWCTVPLPNLNGRSDLDGYQAIEVTLVGYSLPSDVTSAPVSFTGEPNMRKIKNHQVDQSLIRPIDYAIN
jgi:hypothetical protein